MEGLEAKPHGPFCRKDGSMQCGVSEAAESYQLLPSPVCL